MIIVEAILSASTLLRGSAAQFAARSVVRTFKRCLGGLHGLAQGAAGDRRAFVDE